MHADFQSISDPKPRTPTEGMAACGCHRGLASLSRCCLFPCARREDAVVRMRRVYRVHGPPSTHPPHPPHSPPPKTLTLARPGIWLRVAVRRFANPYGCQCTSFQPPPLSKRQADLAGQTFLSLGHQPTVSSCLCLNVMRICHSTKTCMHALTLALLRACKPLHGACLSAPIARPPQSGPTSN